jgi:hypothetical protein
LSKLSYSVVNGALQLAGTITDDFTHHDRGFDG